jgi:hypothetical protein
MHKMFCRASNCDMSLFALVGNSYTVLSKKRFSTYMYFFPVIPMVGGVNDTAGYWWAVSMTPLTSGGRCQ